MKRAYAKRGTGHKRKRSKRRAAGSNPSGEIQLPQDIEELLGLMQDSLEGLAFELGLTVASAILEDEVIRLCGALYERQPERTYTRYGRKRVVVTLGGQKLPIEKPRVRAGSGGEVTLENNEKHQSPDAIPQAVLRRMVRGVSTREYEDVVDMARDGFGVGKSSVSRLFVRASASDVNAFTYRRFEGDRFAALMIDGVEYAGERKVVALGIKDDGMKRVLGLRQGATEKADVCQLLDDKASEFGHDGIRSATTLDSTQGLRPLNREEWLAKIGSAAYRSIEKKLAASRGR